MKVSRSEWEMPRCRGHVSDGPTVAVPSEANEDASFGLFRRAVIKFAIQLLTYGQHLADDGEF